MLLTLLAGALAADLPTLDEVRAEYPYQLQIQGEGARLHLVGLDRRPLPTEDALVLVGRPEDAEVWKRAKETRNFASIGLWVGGGVLLAGSSFLQSQGADNTAALGVTALGAAAVGSGFLVRFVVPKKHLGAWVDRETVVAALDQGTSYALSPTDALAVYEEQRIVLGDDGVLYDGDGRKVKMARLATLLDLGPVEEEYLRTRKMDKVVWISVTGASGGLFVVGGAATFVGFFVAIFGGPPELLIAGMGSMGVGAVGAGVGITGLMVSRAAHENPAHWYDTSGLSTLSTTRDRELRRDLGLPSVRIQPVVSPSWVGMVGTF